jgi:hypothetical protein
MLDAVEVAPYDGVFGQIFTLFQLLDVRFLFSGSELR